MRQSAKQFALHPLERRLAVVVIVLLVFLPWASGGMLPWSQYLAFALALRAFIFALTPRHYTPDHHDGGHMRLIMWPKLLHFPVFWLGLVYFVLIICQVLNPAWIYRSSAMGWWMESIPCIEWLPQGVEDTPFRAMNAWRLLLIHASAWLMICALWVGITRWKAARSILLAVALNGALLAFILLLQRATSSTKMLWIFPPPTNYFCATFTYKNHAGEFFALVIPLCLGLAMWFFADAARNQKKSNPGMILIFCGLFIFAALMFTYARAATAVTFGFLILFVIVFAVRLVMRWRHRFSLLKPILVAGLGAALLASVLLILKVDTVWNKFGRLMNQDHEVSVVARRLATQATLDMAKDQPVFGHGGGSFRFLFPLYQQHYPEIWNIIRWDGLKITPRRLYWEHAHNDYAEFMAEFGLVGVVLALALVGCGASAAGKFKLWRQVGPATALSGAGLIAILGLVDFPTHNPAIVFTVAAIVTLALRWAQFSRR